MTVTEILQLADHLVFAQKQKHLDENEKLIIKGMWEDKTYGEIADECNLSESRVRNIGSKLLQILKQLNEKIDKSNFRSIVENLTIESSPNSLNVINSNNNNFCHTQTFSNSQPENQENNNTKSSYQDLTFAPKIFNFYNRETELKTLSNWICKGERPFAPTRLISVLGLSGIGKTYLVKRFVDLNLEQFEVIIWKNLKFPKSLDLLINDILKVCQVEIKESLDDKLKQLFEIFTQKRCLIVIDDVQNIFITGQFVGQYQTEYKDYQKFFKMITETQHQSNIILISQEKCAEMNCLDQQLDLSKYLELSGLNDPNILENTGLKNQDSWLQLMNLYEGNLNYLKDIVTLILDVYDGEVAEFLEENRSTGILPVNNINSPINNINSPVITQNMQSNFNDLFDRLSPIEKQIILELSKFDQPRSREQLNQNLTLSSVDFINGLQSLQQRYLVTKIKQDQIMFKMSLIFREYVRNCC